MPNRLEALDMMVGFGGCQPTDCSPTVFLSLAFPPWAVERESGRMLPPLPLGDQERVRCSPSLPV